jgi:PAS domain S-box-containing protein
MKPMTEVQVAALLGLDAHVLPSWTQGVILTDSRLPDNPIIYANKGFCKLTGYRLPDIVGRNCRFLQGPDTRPATVAIIRTAVDTRQRFDGDILNYRQDGTPFWNHLSLGPLDTPEGQGLFVGLQFDVSFRHRNQ